MFNDFPISSDRRRKLRSETLVIFALILAALSLGGCRICADCEDLAYPAYGGAWQRTQRESGRVGSTFDPGGAKLANLVNRDVPSQPDEIVRELQSEKRTRDGSDDDEMNEEENNFDRDPTPQSPNLRPDTMRDRKLEDIENDDEDRLREKNLDDIEVRIIPGRSPKILTSE